MGLSDSPTYQLHCKLIIRGVTPRALGPGESEWDALYRYLRARNMHVEKAAKQYAETISWRAAEGVDELRHKSGDEALGCDVAVLRKFLPHAQTGCDRAGGPMIFKHMGVQCRVKQCVAEGVSLDQLARYNIWLNEQYMDALAAARSPSPTSARSASPTSSRSASPSSAPSKPPQWSVVVDAAGWHVGLFDSYAFKFLKRTATTDAAHYPELLHRMIIVNAPTSIHAVAQTRGLAPCYRRSRAAGASGLPALLAPAEFTLTRAFFELSCAKCSRWHGA